jgi:hypothetical protein
VVPLPRFAGAERGSVLATRSASEFYPWRVANLEKSASLSTRHLLFSSLQKEGEAERRQTQNQPPRLRARRALSGARTPVGVPPRLLHRRTNATAQLQPCFLGRGFDGRYPSSTYPSPARSAQTGHRAGRTVSEAARERTANPPAGTAPAPPHGLPPVGVP